MLMQYFGVCNIGWWGLVMFVRFNCVWVKLCCFGMLIFGAFVCYEDIFLLFQCDVFGIDVVQYVGIVVFVVKCV